MNKAKIAEFFDADKVTVAVNVVGVGAVGSNVAIALAHMGFNEITLWDFDTVEPHNITNQMFTVDQIGMLKVDAVEASIKAVNPDCNVIKHKEGLRDDYTLSGIVFLCVDNIDLRRKIVEENQRNKYCACISDFRMRLTDAQYYFADMQKPEDVKRLLKTMQFTHDEAKDATPKSACNVELSVIYNVSCIVALGVANVTNWLRTQGENYKRTIYTDLDYMEVQVF